MNIKKLAAAGLLVAGALLVISFRSSDADIGDPELHVYKTPTCGCCGKWVDHMKEAGFKVRVEDVDVEELWGGVKVRHGVPRELSTCHTTVVGDYVIEGHVPAGVVKRFLEEAPEVKGISVPGMPMGSPGMEGPNPQPYVVIAFDGEGNRTVYEEVDPRKSR